MPDRGEHVTQQQVENPDMEPGEGEEVGCSGFPENGDRLCSEGRTVSGQEGFQQGGRFTFPEREGVYAFLQDAAGGIGEIPQGVLPHRYDERGGQEAQRPAEEKAEAGRQESGILPGEIQQGGEGGEQDGCPQIRGGSAIRKEAAGEDSRRKQGGKRLDFS